MIFRLFFPISYTRLRPASQLPAYRCRSVSGHTGARPCFSAFLLFTQNLAMNAGGSNSAVESLLPKQKVASSNLFSGSNIHIQLTTHGS